MSAWFVTAGLGLLLWLLQLLFAYFAKMATPQQMMASGIPQGIPFTGHGSTWFVLVALIPLVATMTALGWRQWSGLDWVWAAALGVLFSTGMHYAYTMAPFPDYAVRGGWLSPAGWTHWVLFAAAIAVLILYFFRTGHDNDAPLVLFAAYYMVLHVFVGNHMVTKLAPPDWFPPYPFWDLGAWGAVLGSALIFSVGSWWALR